MKQQHSRALEPPAVDQVQLVDQASVVFLQQLGRDALTAAGALAKALQLRAGGGVKQPNS